MNLDFSELLNVTVRGLSSLVTLFLITKMLGKKQVSQLSLFDYVIGISIGNFAAEMTINLESNEINGIWAVVLFGLVAYIISLITMKSITLRRFFMGKPTVIIDNGKIVNKNLKRLNFDINDMLEEVRSAGYFDLNEVLYAVMETNGKLSILPKSKYKNVTLEDMNIKKEEGSLCANVIIDGKAMDKNLKYMNKDVEWLRHELKVLGYNDFSNILLATLDSNNKINVYKKEKNLDPGDVLE